MVTGEDRSSRYVALGPTRWCSYTVAGRNVNMNFSLIKIACELDGPNAAA